MFFIFINQFYTPKFTPKNFCYPCPLGFSLSFAFPWRGFFLFTFGNINHREKNRLPPASGVSMGVIFGNGASIVCLARVRVFLDLDVF